MKVFFEPAVRSIIETRAPQAVRVEFIQRLVQADETLTNMVRGGQPCLEWRTLVQSYAAFVPNLEPESLSDTESEMLCLLPNGPSPLQQALLVETLRPLVLHLLKHNRNAQAPTPQRITELLALYAQLVTHPAARTDGMTCHTPLKTLVYDFTELYEGLAGLAERAVLLREAEVFQMPDWFHDQVRGVLRRNRANAFAALPPTFVARLWLAYAEKRIVATWVQQLEALGIAYREQDPDWLASRLPDAILQALRALKKASDEEEGAAQCREYRQFIFLMKLGLIRAGGGHTCVTCGTETQLVDRVSGAVLCSPECALNRGAELL